MGNGTVGKGSLAQRWAQELRGTGAEARGSGACLGSAPRTLPACEPGEQGPGTVCVCGRALAAQLEDSDVRRGELAASGVRALRVRRAGDGAVPAGDRRDGAGMLQVSGSQRRTGHR